jgi:O-antigen/teichoic acid export membrane protein
LIGNRRLARNAVWNLLSLTAPMLVALGAIPALIRTLGADGFGVLTLAWMLIGYCSLFDLGLGRALTKLVSEGSGVEGDQGNHSCLPSTVWTSLSLMTALGCVGALIFAAVSGILSHSILKIPVALQEQTSVSLLWVAAAIPLVTLTAGLRGILEARQRFGSLSIVRTVTGALTFGGPLLAAELFGGLPAVVFTIALIRLLSLIAHIALCAALTPELFRDRRFQFRQTGPLFRFGGWLTVSGLLSPLMTSVDRFLVGIFLPVTNVAYYATPFEIVTKLQVIPAAVTAVLFPAFSNSLVNSRQRARQLYVRGLGVILGILTPLTALVVVLAYPGMRLWLGEEFASHGYRVLQLLAVGVLINAAAFVPSSFLQAAGRPDVNAKLHMIEFPLYIPLVCWLIHVRGIEGAAWAWVLRVTLDSALLFWLARRSIPAPMRAPWEVVNAGTAATSAAQ